MAGKEEKHGAGGHRSPCLLHAKQALYHLSYSPGRCGAALCFTHFEIQSKLDLMIDTDSSIEQLGLKKCSL